MTKLRAPLTFAQAIARVAGVIGWEEACRITKRSDRTVRLWSESDQGGTPTLEQARDLDLAYRLAGGAGAPILESYALQVEVLLTNALASQAELSNDIAAIITETADAASASLAVIQPGASPTQIHRAIAETEEACGASTRLLGRLKSFLPGIGPEGRMGGPTRE